MYLWALTASPHAIRKFAHQRAAQAFGELMSVVLLPFHVDDQSYVILLLCSKSILIKLQCLSANSSFRFLSLC